MARFPLALLAALAVMTGCEDSGVVAPSDGQITVTANPATVVIDQAAGETEGQSTITAHVFDAGGFPLQGVDVLFTASSGSLASAPAGEAPVPVETDANGLASDVLTLTVWDEDTAEVAATSGTLSGNVQVAMTLTGENQPPTAVIDIDPPDEQIVDSSVVFDGSFSSDPDSLISCYKWEIVSNAGTEIVQGPNATRVSRLYSEAQTLDLTLQVSDVVDSATWCERCTGAPSACGADDSYFNGLQDRATYRIVCDPTAPVAAGGPDQTVTLSGGQVVVYLNGGGSNDPESGITSYSWTCGNGTAAQPVVEAVCTYTSAATYTARLTVTNGCGMVSSDDVRVLVNAP